MHLGVLWVAFAIGAGAPAFAQMAPASKMTAIIRIEDGGKASISFGAGRNLDAMVIGPVGGAYLTPMDGGPQTSIALAMQQPNEGVPIIGYRITREAFESAPLCPGGPTAAVVLMYPASGPQKLAAIAGAAPGDPGSRLCALYELSANNPPIPDQGYR